MKKLRLDFSIDDYTEFSGKSQYRIIRYGILEPHLEYEVTIMPHYQRIRDLREDADLKQKQLCALLLLAADLQRL